MHSLLPDTADESRLGKEDKGRFIYSEICKHHQIDLRCFTDSCFFQIIFLLNKIKRFIPVIYHRAPLYNSQKTIYEGKFSIFHRLLWDQF